MLQKNQFEENKRLMNGFLLNRPIPEKYRIPERLTPYGFIYCIENKLTGKRYIGSTHSFWVGTSRPRAVVSMGKRASQYLYEYNRAMKRISETRKKKYRPILQAMVDLGFENFIMYPIAETTEDNHIEMENYFIDIYDTIKSGYNIGKATELSHSGRILSVHDKIVRSEAIIAVNMNENKLIHSQSMKLLADRLGTTKDMIKNVARAGKPYKGWFIFYIDDDKRNYVLQNNVLHDENRPKCDRHSQKSKDFYQSLCSTIDCYVKEFDRQVRNEYFPGFERLPDLLYT